MKRVLSFAVLFWLTSTGQASDWVDEMIAPFHASGNFMGVVLLAKGDEILTERAYGQALLNQREHNVDSVFHIASVSKSITAAAVMRLAEEGKLDIHAPLTRYLPGYPNGEKITAHHLLTHTSGIPNINGMPEYHLVQQRDNTPASLVDVFRDKPLLFAPGDRYAYSNSNYNLLALLIEERSGMDYGQFLEQTFFRPFGMAATGHGARGKAVNTKGYEGQGARNLEPAPSLNWSAKTGNGCLHATARDLYTWARAVKTGKALDSDSMAQTFRNHIDHTGYGWFVRESHGRPCWYINGRSPGYSSFLAIYPEDDLTVVVLSNVYVPVATRLGRDLAGRLLGKASALPKFQTSPLPRETLADYTGRYRFGPDFYTPGAVLEVTFRDGYLHTQWGAMIHTDSGRFIQRRYWSDVQFSKENGRIIMIFDEFRGIPLGENQHRGSTNSPE